MEKLPIKTKIINIFGGPGCGKSTLASEIFLNLKKKNILVENLPEFCKPFAYTKNNKLFEDPSYQTWITFNQKHQEDTLYGKVDYIVQDSPFLLGATYYSFIEPDNVTIVKYEEFLVELIKKRNYINILLKRSFDYIFQEEGRNQNLQSAIDTDNRIKNLLIKYDIQFHEFNYNETLDYINSIT